MDLGAHDPGSGRLRGPDPRPGGQPPRDYYVWARIGAGLTSMAPFGAPNSYYSFYVTETFYGYDAEADAGWQLGAGRSGPRAACGSATIP